MNVHLAYSLIGENYHALYDPLDGPYSVPGFSDYIKEGITNLSQCSQEAISEACNTRTMAQRL